jgi:adenylate cyclase
MLQVLPTCRDHMRELGRWSDPEFIAGFVELERICHQEAGIAADVYVESVARRLEAKNLELNRLNHRLQLQERVLAAEVQEALRQLERSNEFSRRVIETLSSGVVVAAPGGTITLYSGRVEQILGIPAEQALGTHVGAIFMRLRGTDVEQHIARVLQTGQFPLTRFRLTRLDGRERSVYVRAQRMFDSKGEPEGTLIVLDDVTERELLVDEFSRYVSRPVVERLMTRAEPLGLEGEQRVCTILFADIRGFTTLCEGVAPTAVHRLLNEYFHVMVEEVSREGGFVDKFIGDNVMAIFSTGEPADGALAALRAAMAIRSAMAELNRQQRERGAAVVEVGIGINTGEVLLGNVGNHERMNFTALGDVVNVASRLQSLAQPGEILIGPETARHAAGRVRIASRGAQAVKGRRAPVEVFAVSG